MKVTYQGKEYTVGNTYTIPVSNYRLRQDSNPVEGGYQKVKAKLVFSEYEDAEGYYDGCHLGLRFRYTRVWRGTPGYQHITMPDAIGCTGLHD